MENEGKQGKEGKRRRGDEKERGEAHARSSRNWVVSVIFGLDSRVWPIKSDDSWLVETLAVNSAL